MNAALQLGDGSCLQRWRDQPYREHLVLRGRRPLTLRPARRSDAAALQGFFEALSPQARSQRFHGGIRQLPASVLRSFTTQVPRQHIALVAMDATDDGLTRMVGEARYVVDGESPAQAEFALAVVDDWQRAGLGRALLQRLATFAAAQGLVRLHGAVQAGNAPMLAMAQSLGGSVVSSADGLIVQLPL